MLVTKIYGVGTLSWPLNVVCQLVLCYASLFCLFCFDFFLSVCPSFYLSVCPSVCPSICLSVCLFICLSSICLSVCLSVRLSVYLFLCMFFDFMSSQLSVTCLRKVFRSIHVSVCLLVFLSVCLSVSACLCVHFVSLYLTVVLSAYLSPRQLSQGLSLSFPLLLVNWSVFLSVSLFVFRVCLPICVFKFVYLHQTFRFVYH